MNLNLHKKKNWPIKVGNKKKTCFSSKGILNVIPKNLETKKNIRGNVEIKRKKLELNEYSIEGKKEEGGIIENIRSLNRSKDSGIQMNKETPKKNYEPQEGLFKVVRERKSDFGRRFTFIAKGKKKFLGNLAQEGPQTPKAVAIGEPEPRVDLSQEKRRQYDLFLKKQVAIIHSKNRCQSQNGIFRSFQSLIQYLT
jgi:hypothetical protein